MGQMMTDRDAPARPETSAELGFGVIVSLPDVFDQADPPQPLQDHAALGKTLAALSALAGGRLAIIAVEPIAMAQRALPEAPAVLIGCGGLERRSADGAVTRIGERATLAPARERLQLLVQTYDDIRLIDDGLMLTVAFPATSRAAYKTAHAVQEAAAASPGSKLDLRPGTARIYAADVSTGDLVRDLLATPEFAGRPAAFAGSRLSDHPGFEAVNDAGGMSIFIGLRPLGHARAAAPTLDAMIDMLKREGMGLDHGA